MIWHIRYWLRRLSERLAIWVAYKLPRKVAMWATVRVGAHATQGKYSNQIVPELLFFEALKRWEEPSE